jgi:hypothetical protein
LTVLREAISEHYYVYGPSMTVVDDLRRARPYNQSHAALPQGGPPTLSGVDEAIGRTIAGQRAKDFKEYAIAHSDAPTVVAWHRRGDDDDLGLTAIRAASLVVIEAKPAEYGGPIPVVVTARTDLGKEFPSPVRLVLPRLEWGFDMSDLEPDDEPWGAEGDAPIDPWLNVSRSVIPPAPRCDS